MSFLSDLSIATRVVGFVWVLLLSNFAVSENPPERSVSSSVEARGLWVTRWDYRSPLEIRDIMKQAHEAGFNQVYFQVRAAADAYYRSSLEPWAARLSGKLGRDPGWDPLERAICEAHQMGLELHAWVNIATAWTGSKRPPLSRPRHILRKFPGWRVKSHGRIQLPNANGYVFVSPAHPGFQAHIEAVISEIVGNYEVDGLHLDYARYPAAYTSFDRMSNRLYRKAKKKDRSIDRAAWQREQLTDLVKRISQKAKSARPGIEVSAAVCGIYENRWGWTSVTQGLVDFHQDSHLWAQTKAVDVLIPMMYWKPTDPPGGRADFLTLAESFKPLEGHVRLLAGINVETGDFSVLEQVVRISRELGYQGVALFAYRALRDRGWFERLPESIFAKPAMPRNWLVENIHWDRLNALWNKWVNKKVVDLRLDGIFDGLFDAFKALME